WRDARSGNTDIYGARLSALGVVSPANGIALCTATGAQSVPRVARYITDDAVAVWQDARSGNQDVYAQRFNTLSVLWGTDGIPIRTGVGDQTAPVMDLNPSSGAIGIAWTDTRNGGPQVWAQLITGSGPPNWPVNGVHVTSATGGQAAPAIVRCGQFDFI